MAAQDKNTIKSYFRRGSRPTEAQFADLVDSYQDANSNLTALASASTGAVGLKILGAVTTAAAVATLGFGAFGQSFVTVATTAAAQQTLGLGTAAFQSVGVSANNIPQLDAGNLIPSSLLPPIPAATTSAAGIARLADQNAMESQTAGRAVTADMMLYHPAMPKAWARWDGTGTAALATNYNVSSLTDNGVGDYTLGLSITLSTVGACIATCNQLNRTEAYTANVISFTGNSVTVRTQRYSAGATDLSIISLTLFGDIG